MSRLVLADLLVKIIAILPDYYMIKPLESNFRICS